MTRSLNFPIPAHHYWVDRLNPWIVHFGNGFGVRWYGLAYLARFLLAGWILARWARRGKLPIPETEVASFILYAALGVMIGGRLGYCLLYNLHEVAYRPLEILELWHGGMASHGGMAGLIVAVWLFARRRGLKTLLLLDAAAATGPLGIALGRIANFVNGELWGRPTRISRRQTGIAPRRRCGRLSGVRLNVQIWIRVLQSKPSCGHANDRAQSRPRAGNRESCWSCLLDLRFWQSELGRRRRSIAGYGTNVRRNVPRKRSCHEPACHG